MPKQRRKKTKMDFNPFENNKSELLAKFKAQKANVKQSKAPRRGGARGS
jgi:hypothetical protein